MDQWYDACCPEIEYEYEYGKPNRVIAYRHCVAQSRAAQSVCVNVSTDNGILGLHRKGLAPGLRSRHRSEDRGSECCVERSSGGHVVA